MKRIYFYLGTGIIDRHLFIHLNWFCEIYLLVYSYVTSTPLMGIFIFLKRLLRAGGNFIGHIKYTHSESI